MPEVDGYEMEELNLADQGDKDCNEIKNCPGIRWVKKKGKEGMLVLIWRLNV